MKRLGMNFQRQVDMVGVAIFFLLGCLSAISAQGQSINYTYPDPKYVFLLREEGALLSSVPERNMSAKVRSTLNSEKDLVWEEDLNFGTVFRCAKETKSFLEISDIVTDNPAEGFAIAFWFKARDDDSTANNFSGLLSQGQGDSKVSISLENSTVCLGSTESNCRNFKGTPEITDGGWHHVTLTTYSQESSRGFRVYVDGVRYGEIEEDEMTVLDGSSLFLCASGGNGTDIFDGSIVDLVIFDRGLNGDEVVINYNVRNPFRDSINPGMCSDVAIPGLLTQTSCAEGFHCYKLSLNDLVELTNTHDYDELLGRIGLCVPEIYTNLLPSPLLVPTAYVFYPLVSNRVESFPMSLYSGSSRGASVVPDRLFGQTLYCNGSDNEYIALDPVAYGMGGGFTINFWFKPDHMSPEGYSWLFSHGSMGNDEDAFGPNQVQIYLSEYGQQTDYGHVSAYIRDSNDEYSGIDSTAILNGDGTVGTLIKKAPDGPDDKDDVYDGDWHMATVTSHRDRDKGYVLYVDGKKVNELSPETDIENVLGQNFEVSGGDMMLMTGNIVLCSRGYGERFPYHGQIAWLSFWEEALLEEQVQLLYDSVAQYGVKGSVITPSEQDDVILDTNIGVEVIQYSTSGKKCLFPSLYQNEVSYGCILIDGVNQCDVGGGVWEECGNGLLDDETVISARAKPGQLLESCLISESPKEAESNSPKGCDQGLTCTPTRDATDIGVCDMAPSPIAEYHIFNWMHFKDLPLPKILYPLLDGSLMAITHPQYIAEQFNIGWSWDSAFRASVPRCSSSPSSKLNLFAGGTQDANVGTMCVWFAVQTPSSNIPYKQVIMSTQDVVPFDVTLKQEDHTKYTIGLEIFDKDGDLTNPASFDTGHVVDPDDTWHFACVGMDISNKNSSILDLYLDGQLVTETIVNPDQFSTKQTSFQDIVLCPSLDGAVSQYIYYEEHLNEKQIKSAYSIFEESGILENTQEASSGGLSGGEIAGIVIGSIAGATILLLGIIYLAKRVARNRPTSFKKFDDDAALSSREFSNRDLASREFSYEYEEEEQAAVTPEKQFSYEYLSEEQGLTDHIMMNNPVYGLQTPALQTEPQHSADSDTSSSTSPCAINGTNSSSHV